jgi:hypothetical protein
LGVVPVSEIARLPTSSELSQNRSWERKVSFTEDDLTVVDLLQQIHGQISGQCSRILGLE